MNYRVLVADDHPLYRDALRTVVTDTFPDADCEDCADIASALERLARGNINLVLLDLGMPDSSRLDGLRRLREQDPTVPVIICSAHDDPRLVREALNEGAAGYLPKSSGVALTRHALHIVRAGGIYVPAEAVRAVAGGSAENAAAATAAGGEDTHLTPRQLHVLALMEQGLPNKTIARELGIGEITVKAHVSAILRKLGVDNRVQAVLAARDRLPPGGGQR